MTEDGINGLVQRAYEGEVIGEALFAGLVTVEKDPVRRSKLLACQLLEEQTKASVETLAFDLGMEIGPADEQVAAGARAAEALAGLAWEELMGAIASGTSGYRSLYAELAETAPDRANPVLAELVGHEEALNAFTAAEAAGTPDALELLLAALDPPHREQATAAR